jgi:hypothetical protein
MQRKEVAYGKVIPTNRVEKKFGKQPMGVIE